MEFTKTEIPGAFIIDIVPHCDDRGFFARSFCGEEFSAHSLPTNFPQCNISYNIHAGTLRGMHFNAPPHEEGKLVRCTQGAIWDVIVDLRSESPTYRHHIGLELSAETHRALYVPPGLAHGFLTLTDDSFVFYQMSQAYVPGAECGLKWDDPALGIAWPRSISVISPRDDAYETLSP